LEAETAAFGYPRERLFFNSESEEGPLAIRDKAPSFVRQRATTSQTKVAVGAFVP